MEMASCRRRDLFLLVACAVTFFLWIHATHLRSEIQSQHVSAVQNGPHSTVQGGMFPADHVVEDAEGSDGGSNATLGFGKIIAVSTRTSHRRASLLLSAELTGIEITIPDQPVWTDADINRLKTKENSKILRASALAWLGHLNALRWFVQSGQESALILEDDVNWDIHLRYRQIPVLARAFRDLLSQNSPQPGSRHHDSLARSQSTSGGSYGSYWPPASEWELLYMGHCGDFFPARNLSHMPHTIYPDASTPSFQGLHVDTQKFMYPLPVPARHRILHKSAHPLCTFAYAVTRESAKRLLAEFSTEEPNKGTWAYDVRILEACRDLGWKCWSVNPELFHHSDEHASEIQAINGKPLFQDDKQPTYDELQRDKARGTPNIGCGIRTIAEKMGSDRKSAEVVRMASKFDGLCPVPMDEIDALRGQIEIKGRDGLPID